MIKNYFKSALRNLIRNKSFFLINSLGLALGLACSLFIFLWVMDERNMDTFNPNTEQLYQVYERQATGGKINPQYNTPGIMADEMKRVLPQVQYAAGFAKRDAIAINTFQVGDKVLKEDGGYAGVDFFKMFNYTLIEGSSMLALSSPSDIAISKKMAVDFFESPENAIGKTIRFNNERDFSVSAIFEIPKNASTKFDYLINWFAFLEQQESMKSWNNTGVSTYIMLKENTNPVVFEKQISHFLDKYSDFDGDYSVELGLQRFDEGYLYSNFNSAGYPEEGRIEYVRLFSMIAIFILLIACINFMNLTTAFSVKRAKEIGVRKVSGAFRSSLIIQFIGEALMLTFMSMIIALALVILLLPTFNAITQKQISLPLTDGPFWWGIFIITTIVGLLSGSYPAFFLSSFNPIKVLKGTLKLGNNTVAFRKGLVVFQFILSIILIVGTIVVSRQVNYIQTKNLGYDRENLIYIPQEGEISPKYTLFKQEALKIPGIRSISRISYQTPTDMTNTTWGIDWEGKDPTSKPTFTNAGVGYDFAKTMNMEIVQGHDFSKDYATDSIGYVLNEAAVKAIGYEDPIGKSFTLWGRKATIIGVVKDFNFKSLHEPIKPLVMYLENNGWTGTLLIKAQAGQTVEVLTNIERLWKEMNPEFPYTYHFSDEEYNELYKSEQMVGKLSNYFAFLAIFISCLGLLGLVMFTAEQRIKEIGIRKVLGASTTSVFSLLSKEFLTPVVIALLVSIPIAWLAMDKWLQGYAYRVDINWWMFLLAGALAIVIALITVSFQVIRAAIANPVASLRTE